MTSEQKSALLKCSVCKQLLPAEHFYPLRGRTNGKRDSNGVIRSCRCKDCQIKDYLKLDPRKKLLYAARKAVAAVMAKIREALAKDSASVVTGDVLD